MEEDNPGRHEDKKLQILDMAVWTDDHGYLLYQHYEKEMSTKLVLSAHSAQSSCKRNVHVQEVLRRILNCSPRLNWQEQVAPILTNYMTRMKVAGYAEMYRRQTLQHAFRIYEKMKEEDEECVRPLNRPADWNVVERRKNKKREKCTWSTKGGHIAPIFVPPTPNGELAANLWEIADREKEAGVNFKVIETGGNTNKSQVQVSNLTGTAGCEAVDCLACMDGRGDGGRSNINYVVECKLCPGGDRSMYIGESSMNLYTRAKEHEDRYRRGRPKSFMKKHQIKKHNGLPGSYKAKVTDNFMDCLSRQVSEGVSIRRSQVEVLNSKTEWHQPPLWRVQSELQRG